MSHESHRAGGPRQVSVFVVTLSDTRDEKSDTSGAAIRAALSEARKIIRRACHILAELGDDALATV